MEMTKDEEEGVKMIIALQKMVGLIEPEDKALAGWRSMNESQKQTTRTFYSFVADKLQGEFSNGLHPKR